MPAVPRLPVTVLIAGLLLTLALLPACGGSGASSTPTTDAGDAAAFAQAVEGAHRYFATHENLGTCEGAADDGEETLEITFRDGGLSLRNLDYDWTQEYDKTGTNEYYRLTVTSEGHEWHQTLTLTADGFIMYSETNDPKQVGEVDSPQPCFRYSYALLD